MMEHEADVESVSQRFPSHNNKLGSPSEGNDVRASLKRVVSTQKGRVPALGKDEEEHEGKQRGYESGKRISFRERPPSRKIYRTLTAVTTGHTRDTNDGSNLQNSRKARVAFAVQPIPRFTVLLLVLANAS